MNKMIAKMKKRTKKPIVIEMLRAISIMESLILPSEAAPFPLSSKALRSDLARKERTKLPTTASPWIRMMKKITQNRMEELGGGGLKAAAKIPMLKRISITF